MKKLIKEKFFDHFEYISNINDSQQEVAKKIIDEYNDDRMLVFFEFRDYLWGWDSTEQDTELFANEEPMSIAESLDYLMNGESKVLEHLKHTKTDPQ